MQCDLTEIVVPRKKTSELSEFIMEAIKTVSRALAVALWHGR